ncbi:MAG: zf-TFIIB domain-containing protein [Vicinamibacterales bacterium]
MTCPGCGQEMASLSLAGHYGRTIAIDVCHGCNHVWFDAQEDLHLAPGGVLALFEDMGRAAQEARTVVAARKPCPRCGSGLLRTRDRIKTTPYEYFRCTQGHGRFMGFGAFLRARRFVRDLDTAEVTRLRADARVIKCVNCGASTDITLESVCQYCRAPIAVLDADQLSKTLAELEAAEAARGKVDPAWPLKAAQVRRETEAAFAALQGGRGATPHLDLIEAGLAAFANVISALRR